MKVTCGAVTEERVLGEIAALLRLIGIAIDPVAAGIPEDAAAAELGRRIPRRAVDRGAKLSIRQDAVIEADNRATCRIDTTASSTFTPAERTVIETDRRCVAVNAPTISGCPIPTENTIFESHIAGHESDPSGMTARDIAVELAVPEGNRPLIGERNRPTGARDVVVEDAVNDITRDISPYCPAFGAVRLVLYKHASGDFGVIALDSTGIIIGHAVAELAVPDYKQI